MKSRFITLFLICVLGTIPNSCAVKKDRALDNLGEMQSCIYSNSRFELLLRSDSLYVFNDRLDGFYSYGEWDKDSLSIIELSSIELSKVFANYHIRDLSAVSSHFLQFDNVTISEGNANSCLEIRTTELINIDGQVICVSDSVSDSVLMWLKYLDSLMTDVSR
ncbi:MAG: hypothetical protein EP346_01790 [Bacteroidetes bacterium]|nr:MAG: hypothetical protein EP346_01790 [Bacteroidota bacterium]